MGLTVFRSKVEMVLSSYSRMLMVSKAQVLSASSPDLSDIITLQASGVPAGVERSHNTLEHDCRCYNTNRAALMQS